MLTAIANGFKDGYDQPGDFNFGMSYDSRIEQFVYDVCSHAGQFLGRVFNR